MSPLTGTLAQEELLMDETLTVVFPKLDKTKTVLKKPTKQAADTTYWYKNGAMPKKKGKTKKHRTAQLCGSLAYSTPNH